MSIATGTTNHENDRGDSRIVPTGGLPGVIFGEMSIGYEVDSHSISWHGTCVRESDEFAVCVKRIGITLHRSHGIRNPQL